ncbi:DUF7310 family coiled-coil domain-containing protein [Haloplanus salilacus]|uniref:DUF7310 family coiled-coil domain-containing protein n=1 Tax=Haloplanus salilacus TaxID=2949994 RepID=UPI0030D5B08D
MDDRLDDRIDAVERAISDGHAVDGLPDTARMEQRLDDIETNVEELDDRLADLEAAVQALRGFAGGVRAVDEEVERRANAAVARVERLEADLHEAPDHGDDRAQRDVDGPRHTAETTVDDDTGREDGVEWHDDGEPDRATEGASGGVGAGTDGWRGGSDADGTGSTERSGTSRRTDATLAETAATAAAAVDRPDIEDSETRHEYVDEDESGALSLADRIRRLL